MAAAAPRPLLRAHPVPRIRRSHHSLTELLPNNDRSTNISRLSAHCTSLIFLPVRAPTPNIPLPLVAETRSPSPFLRRTLNTRQHSGEVIARARARARVTVAAVRGFSPGSFGEIESDAEQMRESERRGELVSRERVRRSWRTRNGRQVKFSRTRRGQVPFPRSPLQAAVATAPPRGYRPRCRLLRLPLRLPPPAHTLRSVHSFAIFYTRYRYGVRTRARARARSRSIEARAIRRDSRPSSRREIRAPPPNSSERESDRVRTREKARSRGSAPAFLLGARCPAHVFHLPMMISVGLDRSSARRVSLLFPAEYRACHSS